MVAIAYTRVELLVNVVWVVGSVHQPITINIQKCLIVPGICLNKSVILFLDFCNSLLFLDANTDTTWFSTPNSWKPIIVLVSPISVELNSGTLFRSLNSVSLPGNKVDTGTVALLDSIVILWTAVFVAWTLLTAMVNGKIAWKKFSKIWGTNEKPQ